MATFWIFDTEVSTCSGAGFDLDATFAVVMRPAARGPKQGCKLYTKLRLTRSDRFREITSNFDARRTTPIASVESREPPSQTASSGRFQPPENL